MVDNTETHAGRPVNPAGPEHRGPQQKVVRYPGEISGALSLVRAAI